MPEQPSPQPPLPQVRTERLAPCPECGESFVPRGLAAHRRMSHGVASSRAATNGQANGSDMLTVIESLACLRRVLESLSGVLGRMDERLERLENSQADAVRAMKGSGALEHGLEEVLAEIARVKQETDRRLAEWGGTARTAEEQALTVTSFTKLAELRKRQASLVYRLRELKAGESGDAACL